jgi:bacillithiol biosynthesis cysteine-adding enzyme BshC
MHVLFGAEGLVVVNGDDVRLKKTCTDIIKDELLYKQSFRIVNKTSSRLAERYKLQAHPREINLFFIEENVRERITFNANTKEYAVVNTNMRFGQEEMMEIAASKPEKLSPNVILRPLFQQRVLPSLAYVGGGGELSYWLQLKELFTTYHTAFPMLLLRNSALLIDKQVSERMQKLNLSVQDIFADENTLVKHYLQRNAAAELSLAVQKQEIEKLFNTIVQQSNRIDPSLEKTVLAEKQSVFNSLDKLEAKLLKAEKQKADVTIQQIKNIKNKLFPSGELQERNNNFMQYYVQMGAGFFEVLYKNLNPFDVTFSVLSDTP